MDELTPFQYGLKAFKEGKTCTPALDQAFLESHIKGLMVGEGAIELMKEWIRGWTKGNLDSPII